MAMAVQWQWLVKAVHWAWSNSLERMIYRLLTLFWDLRIEIIFFLNILADGVFLVDFHHFCSVTEEFLCQKIWFLLRNGLMVWKSSLFWLEKSPYFWKGIFGTQKHHRLSGSTCLFCHACYILGACVMLYPLIVSG